MFQPPKYYYVAIQMVHLVTMIIANCSILFQKNSKLDTL